MRKILDIKKLSLSLHSDWTNGLMAEWQGRGLQNLVQRFESASDLTKTALEITLTLFFFYFVIHLYYGSVLKPMGCPRLVHKA